MTAVQRRSRPGDGLCFRMAVASGQADGFERHRRPVPSQRLHDAQGDADGDCRGGLGALVLIKAGEAKYYVKDADLLAVALGAALSASLW